MRHIKYVLGGVIVIWGSMFASKTETLIAMLNAFLAAASKVRDENRKYIREHIFVFKPKVDDRSTDCIKSHNGSVFDAHNIESEQDFWKVIDEAGLSSQLDNCVFAFDEAQFFGEWITGLVFHLAKNGARVIVVGLDSDAFGNPFGQMPIIASKAESTIKVNAICVVCGRTASRTQRLKNGKPVKTGEPLIAIGNDKTDANQVSYEARCIHCYVAPEDA